MPRPEILPLTDLPILGAVEENISDDDLQALLTLAVAPTGGSGTAITRFCRGKRFGRGERKGHRPAIGRACCGRDELSATGPLVLLTAGNIGKTLGQYATRWGRDSTTLVVIDEIPNRRAHFVTIGKPHNGLLPVSFHGLEADLEV